MKNGSFFMSSYNLTVIAKPFLKITSLFITPLVEARRIELLSESLSIRTSPGADLHLHSRGKTPEVRLISKVFPLYKRRYGNSSHRSFTADRRPYSSRGNFEQDGSLNQATKSNCLLAFIVFARFIEVGRLYPLFKLQGPRRNLYAPIYMRGFGKGRRYFCLSLRLLSISLFASRFAISSRLS